MYAVTPDTGPGISIEDKQIREDRNHNSSGYDSQKCIIFRDQARPFPPSFPFRPPTKPLIASSVQSSCATLLCHIPYADKQSSLPLAYRIALVLAAVQTHTHGLRVLSVAERVHVDLLSRVLSNDVGESLVAGEAVGFQANNVEEVAVVEILTGFLVELAIREEEVGRDAVAWRVDGVEKGRPRRMRGCEGQCLDVDLMAGREEMLVD